MPSRAELVLRAGAVNIDVTQAKYSNDSVLEQAVLYAEKNLPAATGTASQKAADAPSAAGISGGANV